MSSKNYNNDTTEDATSAKRTNEDPKGKLFMRFERSRANTSKKRVNSTFLDATSDHSQESAIDEAVGEAIDEAIEIIESLPEDRDNNINYTKKLRRESLHKRGSYISARGAKELLHDNSDRLSVLLQNCTQITLDAFSSSDEGDFDE